jgi:hypothetical protein
MANFRFYSKKERLSIFRIFRNAAEDGRLAIFRHFFSTALDTVSGTGHNNDSPCGSVLFLVRIAVL